MGPERYWDDARAKVDREGACRACKSGYMLQFAHVIAQRHDQSMVMDDGSTIRYVDAIDGVPLCIDCHAKYDRRELDLLALLTYEEQAAAVALVGIVRALHRITGQRAYVPVELVA